MSVCCFVFLDFTVVELRFNEQTKKKALIPQKSETLCISSLIQMCPSRLFTDLLYFNVVNFVSVIFFVTM